MTGTRTSTTTHPAGSTAPTQKHAILLQAGVLLVALVCASPASAQTGVYTLNGGTADQTGQTYAATLVDQSAVYVLNGGQLSMTDCVMTKTGDASNVNNSSQYGINAGVLAASGALVSMSGGSVTTNAGGGNGLFATGAGSKITMADATISASGDGAHGVDATYNGIITLSNVNITTTGSNASALATDFGGGTVVVANGTIVAGSTVAGSHSAGLYSTGTITVNGAAVSSLADCGGVIDGANAITLANTSLSGALHGIKIWKTAPAGGSAIVDIHGGSLSAASGDAFYVTNETGNAAEAIINVSGGTAITASTGNILNVQGHSTATFTASGVTLNGNLHADTPGAAVVYLSNTTLTGAAKGVALSLDAGSAWNVTANSILSRLFDPSGVSGLTITNIVGNGHDVHYDAALSENTYLGGKTYALVNGGTLTPGPVPVRGTTWGALKARY